MMKVGEAAALIRGISKVDISAETVSRWCRMSVARGKPFRGVELLDGPSGEQPGQRYLIPEEEVRRVAEGRRLKTFEGLTEAEMF